MKELIGFQQVPYVKNIVLATIYSQRLPQPFLRRKLWNVENF
jgi:hypothetical protein